MAPGTPSPKARRRRGGREAMRAVRSAPLSDDLRPVRPGLEGGTYRPLSDPAVERIHRAALEVLDDIGLAQAPQSGIDAMVAAGARLGDDGRLRFSADLIEDMLSKACRDLTLHAQQERFDLNLTGAKVHYGTAGAAVHVVDVEAREYRDSTLADLYDAARIVERLDNVHFLQRPMVARDVVDVLDLDLNTIYACCAGTSKHVGTSFVHKDNLPACFDLLHALAGDEASFKARPFVSNSNCFVVPPLRFATESCEVLEGCIRRGMPVLLLSAGQAGATSPAPIAGAVVQAVAECLAGVVYVNSVSPGAPAVFGTWPFVSDLRTGAMSGGSGEQALLTAACAQMHRFYGLPGGAAAGIADAKLPDMQAGWEQAISNVMAGLAGLNMVYEAVGMHASLLGFCQESLILGDDMLGQCLRCVRGIEVTEDSVSVETMRRVCLEGPGHFLGHEQTMGVMQTEYVYPQLGDRSSPKEWAENDRPDLLQKAISRKHELLNAPRPSHLSDELDARIRERFNILLPSL